MRGYVDGMVGTASWIEANQSPAKAEAASDERLLSAHEWQTDASMHSRSTVRKRLRGENAAPCGM